MSFQMAGTADVLKRVPQGNSLRYTVLVPNLKGLEVYLSSGSDKFADEIIVFSAASESFNKANLNCSIADSLKMMAPVIEKALAKGIRVRGAISTVVGCPFEGPIAPEKVRDVVKEMKDLGCYQIALGDTIGVGNPVTFGRMLEEVSKVVPVSQLAASPSISYLDNFLIEPKNALGPLP
jgi:hydroxymethylglutaryl-CoA lyase